MTRYASNVSHLSSAELSELVAAHLDGVHNELGAAAAQAREAWSPVKLARKHPLAAAVIVAAVAAGGGVLVARKLRRRHRHAARGPAGGTPFAAGAAAAGQAGASAGPASDAGAAGGAPDTAATEGPASAGNVFTSTLLSMLAGAAGRALPALIVALLESHARKQAQKE